VKASAIAPLALFLVLPAHSAIIHVPDDQPTIQAGIDAAAAGDTVEVACGTYFEHGLVLTRAITIRSETRDPNCVTIDAERLGRVILATHGYPGDTVLDGITIAGGLAGDGGGMLCNGLDSRRELRNVVFRENQATDGGGLKGGLIDLQDCVFEDNFAFQGGGLFAKEFVTATRCRFEGNSVQLSGGGAIAWQWPDEPSVEFSDCSFIDNEATQGGGLDIFFAPVNVVNCDFVENRAAFQGGGVFIQGQSGEPVTLQGCWIARNHAPDGGGMRLRGIEGVFASVTDCVFEENTAGQGGGLHTLSTEIELEHCVFARNHAEIRGGGLLYEDAQFPLVTACTFWGNSSTTGGGIATIATTLVPENILIAFGQGGGAIAGVAEISCSDLYGNFGGDWSGFTGAERADDFGNFSADPLFCDGDLVDDDEDYDLHIRSDSPCAPPGVTGCGLVGALPVGCGPISIEELSWGAIKNRYR
jgi:hypothetical protein